MKCAVCTQPVTDDQPVIPLPELAGGGNIHRWCWDAIKPSVARLMADLGVDDYRGILEDDEGAEDVEASAQEEEEVSGGG